MKTRSKVIKRPVSSRRFVGRSAELQALLEAADAAYSGPSRALVISAEAGLGKSRLLQEFEGHPGARRMRFVRGVCLDYARAPYAPVEEIVGQLDRAEPKVLQRDPQLRGDFEAFLVPAEKRRLLDQTDYRKRKAFDAVSELFRRYSAIRPTVFIFEDLQWSDAGTLEVLEHISRNFAGHHALFVLTLRIDPETREQLEPFLAAYERQPMVTNIALEPFDEPQTLELINSALEGSGPVTDDQRRALYRISGGNPLYIEEFLKNLVDDPSVTKIPRNIEVAVRARFHDLDATQLHVLRFAAILVRFDAALLARLTDMPGETVAMALQKAVTLNLLSAADASGEHKFRNEVLRHVVVRDVPLAEYRSLHRSVAEFFEAQDTAEVPAERLAMHWWEAGETERSRPYERSAAEHASRRYAFKDAIVLYRRALAAAPVPGEGDLQYMLAKAYHHVGRLADCIEALRASLKAYQSSCATARAVEVLLELSKEQYRVLDFAGSSSTLDGALREADALGDGGLLFAVLAWKSWFDAHHNGDVDAALYAAARAEPLRACSEASHLALLDEALSYVHWLRGNIPAWMETAERAVDAATSTGDPFIILHHRSGFASRLTLIDAPGAIKMYEDALALALEKGLADSLLYTRAALAHSQLTAGRVMNATLNARHVLMSDADFPFAKVVAAFVAIRAAYEVEDPTLMQVAIDAAWLDAARGNAPLYGQLLRAHAEIDMLSGNAPRAEARLRSIVESLQAADYNERALVLTAEWKMEDLQPLARTLLQRLAKTTKHGTAMLELFEAYANSGPSRAEHATRAMHLFREMGWRLDEARCLELLGRTVDAGDLYQRCGAHESARRCSVKKNDVAGVFRLTPREEEIACRVAEGKSNKAIAQELVLSDRTVENHLTSIYSKLGIRSRTELAARWTKSNPTDASSF